ncbi:MAG: carboxylesterase family protein [Polyangiales bacterium]
MTVRALRIALPLAAVVACAAADRAPVARTGAKEKAVATPSPLPAPSISASTSASAVTIEDEGPVAEVTAAEGIGIAPGPSGHLGAWLALGPFRVDSTADVSTWRPAQIADDHGLSPKIGSSLDAKVDVRDPKTKAWSTAPASWTLVSSGEGPIDLDRAMPTGGKAAVGYVGGILRVPRAQRLIFLLGNDDGCELLIDGKRVFSRDSSRPERDDDDLVPIDLSAGDHVVLFKLHQRDAGWAMRVRLVDRSFRPPHGVRLVLPGATLDHARTLAKSMSWVRLVRAPKKDGWSIETLVRFPEGAPMGLPITASGGLLEGTTDLIASHALGTIPIGPRSVGELPALIGPISDLEGNYTVRVDVAGRVVDGGFAPRKPVRAAIMRARAFLDGPKSSLPSDVTATIEHQAERLAQFATRGDGDTPDQLADAKVLDAFVADAEAGKDPIGARTGVMRLAHIARADDRAQPIAVYVPKNPDKGKKPLYVGLHGMNGGPLSMVRVFFGGDDDKKSMWELDRAMAGPTPNVDAFVIAPHAHGNAMYRQLGEEEVMDAIAWARARWPSIDPDRIYITGFSMGGIGAASIPFHHPDVFAAAQPLCGYHSYFVRRDVAGRPKRPWEQFLLEDRSNVFWADNGARLPLWIIHGTHDLPEENSGVLIDAYEKKGFSIKHDHPDLGHDVWGWAYDQMQHVSWFAGRRRTPRPRYIHFKTDRPRFGDDAWVHVDRMSGVAEWAVIDARVEGKNKLVVTTKGVDAMHLDRDLVEGEVTVAIDGDKLVFSDEIALHREQGHWVSGAAKSSEPRKSGKITGPIRDVWNDPLVVVYGASDPQQTQANLEVANALATIRWGVDVHYPILRDLDVDPDAIPSKATILVGNARSNRIVRALESSLPVKIAGDNIVFGGKTFSGHQLGAAFVVPHPKNALQYLLVIEGVDALGTFRALSLPELLPDFVVWDEKLAPARGSSLLGFGSVLAAGYFDVNWKAPPNFDDPLASKLTAPKSEKDATPYLP